MKTKKSLLGILIILALMFGLIPAMPLPAHAAAEYTFSTGADQTGTGWSWDGTNNTLTLSGASIGAIVIKPDATIVLTDGTSNTISGSGVNYALKANGALTIQGNGALTVTNERVNNDNIAIYSGGDLTITGGTITATGGGSYNSKVESTGILSGGNLTISGGNVTAVGNEGTTSGRSFGIRIASGKNTTISGENTVVNAYSGSASQHSFAIANGGANPDESGTYGGTMTITGGTITAVGGDSANNPAEGIFVRSGGYLRLQGGHVTVSSGTSAKNNSYAFRSMGTLEISGGILDARSGHSGGSGNYGRSYAIYANEQVIITGGMIAASSDNTSSASSAIQADAGIVMDTSGDVLSVYNAEDLASFVSETTLSLIQADYDKPLRIGAVQYIISTDNDGRGTATVDGGASTDMTPVGTELALVAAPNDDYAFNYWTVNDVQSNTLTTASATYTVNKTDGDAVIKAYFKPAAALTGIDIAGGTSVGSTLTASVTPGGAIEATYQWYRDDVAIEGATDATYTVTEADKGTTIKVVATQYGTEASVNDTISIPNNVSPTPETTPTAVFTATGPDSGTLEGLTPNADYTITLPDSSTLNVTADNDGKYSFASGVTTGSYGIVKKGNGTTTSDSAPQTITITNADAAGPLILVSGTDQSGNGWSWDGTTNTLTLDGADIDGYVWIAADATIQLAEGSVNTISGSDTATKIGDVTYGSSTGIYCSGTLTISGSGSLTVTSTDAGVQTKNNGVQRIYGIYAANDLNITGGTIVSRAGDTNYKSGNATLNGSFGIYAGGNLSITGGNVTAQGGKAWDGTNGAASYGIALANGKSMTVSGADTVLVARASDAKYASYGIKGGSGNTDKSFTGANITIDGATLSAYGAKSHHDASNSASEGIFVGDRGSLILNSGRVYCESDSAVYGSYAFRCRGNLEIHGGVLEVKAGNSQKNGSYGIYAGSGTSVQYGYGSITITDGLITSSTDNTSYDNAAIRAENAINMEISDHLFVFNQNTDEEYVSGATVAMTQADYSKPLRIGRVNFTASVENDGRGTAAAVGGLEEAYFADDMITLTATPNDGYELNCWRVNDAESTYINGNVYTVNKTEGDAVIKACFMPSVPLTGISISGDRIVGSALTATIAQAGALEVSYQWYRDGQPIEGATGTSYTATEEDLNCKITVKAIQYGTELEAETSLATTELIREAVPAETVCYVIRQNVDGSWSDTPAETMSVPAVYQPTDAYTGFALAAYSIGAYEASEADRVPVSAGANIEPAASPLFLYYARNQYPLTFYEDTAGNSVLRTESVYYGAPLGTYENVAPAERENDTFAGWATEANVVVDAYLERDGSLNPALEGKLPDWTATMEGAKSLYPIWIHDRLAVVIDVGAADAVLDDAQSTSFTVDLDEKIVMRYLIGARRDGYDLAGWYTPDGVLWNGDDWAVLAYAADGWTETAGWGVTPEYCDKDAGGNPVIEHNETRKFKYYTVTLTAKWTPLPGTEEDGEHTLTFMDGETVLASSQVARGASITGVPTPVKEHYTLSWTPELPLSMPGYDLTLSTLWTPTKYTVTFKNGDTVHSTIQDIYGAKIEAPADPIKDSFTFIGWSDTIPTYMPDTNPVLSAVWKQNQDKPAAPVVSAVSATEVRVDSPVSGQEYSIDDGKTWILCDGGDVSFTGLKPNTAYEIVTRSPGSDTHMPSPVSDAATLTTSKYDQDAPGAPTAVGTGPKTVTVNPAYSGAEYIIVPKDTAPADSDWANSVLPVSGEVVFGDLTAETEYDVYVRLVETDTQNASPATGPATVQTPTGSLAGAVVTLLQNELDYTGTAQSPTIVKVILNGILLTESTDYAVVSGSSATAPGGYVLTVEGCGAYTDSATATWSIKRGVPVLDGALTVTPITYGDTLSASAITGSMKLGNTPVPGTFAWKEGTTRPAGIDSNQTGYEVTFVPDDPAYESVTLTTKVTVNKAAQDAVPVITISSVGYDRITLAGEEGVEYLLVPKGTSDPDWNNSTVRNDDGSVEFNGLNEATEYTIYARYVETDNYLLGTPASLDVATNVHVDTDTNAEASLPQTVTIPVSGEDESVNVTVELSGDTATVTGADVETVLEAEQVGTVSIDVSTLDESVNAVVVPNVLLTKIADAVADEDNTADSLEIKLPTGSVVFDKEAVAAIADQADGHDLKLNLDDIGVDGLNSEQIQAVEELHVAAVYDAYMTSNGKRISDFKGGTATVTVTYELKDGEFASGILVWYVSDGGEKTVVPTEVEGRLIHFVVAHFSNYVVSYDPAAVTNCPKDETCPISKYDDAETTAWYHDGVHFVLENGIMVGYGNGIFKPNASTSRAMIVQILYNLEGRPAAADATDFDDVAEGAWYYDAVRWASGAGIIEGYGDGRFGPEDTLTREQMAAIIYRHAKTKGQGFTGAWMFLLDNPDASEVSSWADEAMHWMVMKGLIEGRTGGMLVPQGDGTRAEIATIMMRYCTKIAE